ncbi:MAG: serine/threonine protein kinase, partial [Pirellulales bacterium]|nr:serine/threonine protein kinase [Pirellulales bacterium]
MSDTGKPSAEEFARMAVDLELITNRDLNDVWADLGSHNVPFEQLQRELMRRELLTNFQIDRMLRGEKRGYHYGNYKVLYLVGSGTFARVYRAVNQQTGEIVAVKVLRKRFSEDIEQAQRFTREGELMAAIRHPNIVPIYEVYSQGLQHFLVMEFVEGRNLREFIKIRKYFDPLDASRLALDMARGLQGAFEKGLFHRDLKMSNVLVSSRGEAKLVDFGLAAADKNLTDHELTKVPNPRAIDYAGLERATGVRRDDTRSDIYFLGGILYHMLTGRAALAETKERSKRLSRARYEEVIPIQKLGMPLPDRVVRVVNKAMELQPEFRYQTPMEMARDLEKTIERLEENEAAPEIHDPDEEGEATDDTTFEVGTPVPAKRAFAVMFVESNDKMQDLLREKFKKNGFRVLLTADP